MPYCDPSRYISAYTILNSSNTKEKHIFYTNKKPLHISKSSNDLCYKSGDVEMDRLYMQNIINMLHVAGYVVIFVLLEMFPARCLANPYKYRIFLYSKVEKSILQHNNYYNLYQQY